MMNDERYLERSEYERAIRDGYLHYGEAAKPIAVCKCCGEEIMEDEDYTSTEDNRMCFHNECLVRHYA